MSDLQNPPQADVRKALLRRANQECDRFEAAWKAGQRPRIEDHLAMVPDPERPDLLCELILLEVDYRRLAGDHPQAEEFLTRFPSLDRAWLGGVLAGAVSSTTDFATLPAETEPGDALLGCRIGPYLIQERVGSGGMGSVYRALRQDAYQQQVALKVIRPGLDSDEILRRFHTERQVLAELQHPHIARLLDGGATDDGRPYFVMEYIEGEPLDGYCDRHQLGTRERLRLFQLVCEAVQHAHQRQVLHRDLKPGNVLVTADGTPKVMDFGLAKRLDGPPVSSPGAEQTPSGAILGTPSYMAPEQAGGVTRQVGPAVDVYALGAILYELLTGRPPFLAGTPLDTLLQVLSEEPVPPSRLQPKLPRDLETICLKCLHKEPGRRYASVADLAEDVRRFLGGEPIRARPVGTAERLWRWCRRKPALTAAAVLALLALGVAAFFAHQAHLIEEQLRAEKRQYAEEKALLAAMSGEFDNAEKAIAEAEHLGAPTGQVRLLQGQVAFHRGDVLTASKHLEQAVHLMPESVAARAMLAQAYHNSGQTLRIEQLYAEFERMSPSTPEDYLFKGQMETIFRPERCLQTLDEAVRRRNSVIARAVRAEARWNRAMASGTVRDAELALEEAAVARTMLPDNPFVLAQSLYAGLVAAGIYEDRGLARERERVLEQARRDVEALRRFSLSPIALRACFWYFLYVGDEEAAYDLSRRGTEFRLVPMLYLRGVYREALAAAQRGIERGYDVALIERGFILPELPDGDAQAQLAFQKAVDAPVFNVGRLCPPMILLLLGRKEDAIEANQKLRNNSTPIPAWYEGWYVKYLNYQCGLLTAEELLQAAGSSRPKLCEAHFLIGLQHLADGNRARARIHLRQCVATRVFLYWDYMWARAFLKRLEEKDSTWPPWIPARK
jgi:tetratricopeptide (TPR) repeat protein